MQIPEVGVAQRIAIGAGLARLGIDQIHIRDGVGHVQPIARIFSGISHAHIACVHG